MNVRVAMTGRMYHQADELPESWDLPEGACVDDLLQLIGQHLEQPLPPSCLVVLGQRHLGNVQQHENALLTADQELLLLAPVAGG